MKFYCDSCNTKYAISDDKVRGKVLRVRCKHCGHTITVRELENVAKPAKPPKPPIPSAAVPQTNWHFSLNGQSTGPMPLNTLKAKYAAGEIGDETYVWHDSYDGWKPVATVAIFADALRQGFSKKPRFETRAYTGVTEAVQAKPSQERKGVAPKPNVLSKPEINEERLDKLRDKLAPGSGINKLQSARRKPLDTEKSKGFSFEPDPPERDNLPSFNSPDESQIGPNFSDAIADTNLADDINTGFLPMDSGEETPYGEPRDLFAPGAETYGLDVDSEAVPIFPDNPTLGDPPSEGFSSSKSLLIEVERMKKADRRKSMYFLLIGLFVALLIATVGTYMYVNRDIEEVVVEEKAEEREAKILAYSKGEIAARFVQLDDMVITKGELEPEEDEIDPEEEPEDGKKKSKGKTSKTKKGKKDVKKKGDKGKKESNKPEDIRKRLLSTGSAVNRPKDTIGTSTALKSGLSRVQAQAGFKKVSRSVSTCRQRHASRSGKELESAKVKISVEVMPTGKVATFRISPGTLRHTAFDSCMKTKRETWRFAKFGGKPVKINRTFILQ